MEQALGAGPPIRGSLVLGVQSVEESRLYLLRRVVVQELGLVSEATSCHLLRKVNGAASRMLGLPVVLVVDFLELELGLYLFTISQLYYLDNCMVLVMIVLDPLLEHFFLYALADHLDHDMARNVLLSRLLAPDIRLLRFNFDLRLILDFAKFDLLVSLSDDLLRNSFLDIFVKLRREALLVLVLNV